MSSVSRTSSPIVSANWIYSGLRFLELSQEGFVKNDCSFQEVILFSTLTPLTNMVKHMIPIKILNHTTCCQTRGKRKRGEKYDKDLPWSSHQCSLISISIST